jgi:hypothetical protein
VNQLEEAEMRRDEALTEIAGQLQSGFRQLRYTIIWQVFRRGNRGDLAGESDRDIADSVFSGTHVRWLNNDSMADLDLPLGVWTAWYRWSALREADRQAHAHSWQDHVSTVEVHDEEDEGRTINLIDLIASDDETPEYSILRREQDLINKARVDLIVSIMVKERKILAKYEEDFTRMMWIYVRDRVKNFSEVIRSVNPKIPRNRAHEWKKRFWDVVMRSF